MNVYRIAFRLRGKEYQTISLSKSEQPAMASVEALAPLGLGMTLLPRLHNSTR
jgi:hypothetical protein